MTVEEWELIAHVHAYRKDGNVPKQERYVQAIRIYGTWKSETRAGLTQCMETLALATRWKRLVALPVAVASVYLSIGM